MIATQPAFAGWTLGEALERCVDPDAIAACKEAEGAWRDIGSPTRFVWPSAYVDGHDEANRERSRSRSGKASYLAVRKASQNLIDHLRSLLASGRIVAWGRRESPLFEPMFIQPSAWNALRIVDRRKSTARESTQAKTEIFDVRVFPVLRSPNAATLVAGKSFVEAFRDFVLNDPEVAARAKEAMRSEPDYARVFIEGRCFPYGVEQWGVTWADFRVVEYNDPSGWGGALDPVPESVEPADRVLVDRVLALLGLLRSGVLTAVGLPASPNVPASVPRTLWSHEDFHFDGRSGDFLEWNPEADNPPVDRLIKRWSGLLLERRTLVETVSGDDALNPVAVGDSLTSRVFRPRRQAAKTATTTVNARRACEDWLAEEMRRTPTRRRHPKAHWRAKALGRWRGKLSARGFDAAWSAAIAATGAIDWSAAGAPKHAQRRKSSR